MTTPGHDDKRKDPRRKRPRRKRPRQWRIAALAGLATALVAMASCLVFRTAIATAALDFALREAGLEKHGGRVVAVGPRHLVIRGLAFGSDGAFRAETITLGYDAFTLMAGRAETLVVDGAHIILSKGFLDVFGTSGDEEADEPAKIEIPDLPVARVALRDLSVDGQQMPVPFSLRIAGNLRAPAGAVTVALTAEIATPAGGATARLTGELRRRFPWSATLSVASERLFMARSSGYTLLLSVVEAEIDVTAHDLSLGGLTASAKLAGTPSVAARPYPRSTLSVTVGDGVADMRATVGGSKDDLNLTASATVGLTHDAPPLDLAFTGEIPAALAAAVATPSTPVSSGAIAVRAEAHGILTNGIMGPGFPTQGSDASLTAELAVRDLTIPGVASAIAGSIPLGARLDRTGDLSLAIVGALRLTGMVAPTDTARLPPGRYDLALLPGADAEPDRIARLLLPATGGGSADALFDLGVETPLGALSARIDGVANRADLTAAPAFTAIARDIAARGIRFGPLAGATLTGNASLTGTPEGRLAASLDARATADSMRADPILLEQATVDLDASAFRTEAGTEVFFNTPMKFRAGSVVIPGTLALTDYGGRLSPQTDRPVLTLTPDDALHSAGIVLGAAPLRARLLDGSGAAIDGRHPSLTVTRDPGQPVRFRGTGGDLRLPGQGLRIQGISADLAVDPDDPGAMPPLGRLEIRSLGLTAPKPAIRPLRVALRARPISDTRLRTSGTVSIPGTPARIDIGGHHDLPSGRGALTLAMKPLAIGRSGIFLGQLSPLLADSVTWNAGTLAVNGTLIYGKGALRPRLTATVADAELGIGGITLRPVNSAVTISSLSPPRTPRDQAFAAGIVDIGLPLTDMDLRFHIANGERLEVETLTTRLAGGAVSVDAFPIDLKRLSADADLKFAGVSLARLLEATTLDGIEATGVLEGTIPIRLRDGRVGITGGALKTREPGLLTYRPAVDPADLASGHESVDLLFQALENFHYRTLRLGIERALGGQTEIGLSLKGANPDVYDGYPIALNVNLGGKLDKIVGKSLEGFRITDEIEKQLLPFQ